MMWKTVAIAVLVAGPVLAGEQTVKLDVPGMYCASCPFIVQSAISDVDGVKTVNADLDTRTATVVFDDEKTNVEAIETASANAGYPASLVKSGS